MMSGSEVIVAARNDDEVDLLKARGGRIDPLRAPDGAFDADTRVDQAIAESFPASDAPSWDSGLDRNEKGNSEPEPIERRLPTETARAAEHDRLAAMIEGSAAATTSR
jgi:hypothetical protein